MTHTARCQNILLIEDDLDILDSMIFALQSEGFRVTTASNGKEALELLRKSPQAWHPCFIVLDLMMPVMNGWEFLLHLQADSVLREIPVMICSAVADHKKVPGVAEHLQKPVNLETFLQMCRKYCDPSGDAHSKSGLP